VLDATDRAALVVAFCTSKAVAAQQAVWSCTDPKMPVDTCRYCGKRWQLRFGSRLEGHAACIVTEDFKRRVGAILRKEPRLTYAVLAEVLGVTPGIVRSWAFSAGIAGPIDHTLRRRGEKA